MGQQIKIGMELNIVIVRKDIMTEVKKTTAYLAAHKGADQLGNTQYPNIVATDSNEEILERFFTEAIETLRFSASEYLSTAEFSTGNVVIKLRLTENYDNSVDLGKEINSYIVNAVVARWLSTVDKEDAETYVNESAAHLKIIVDALSLRKRPTRPSGIALLSAQCQCGDDYQQVRMHIDKAEQYHNIKQAAYAYAHALNGEGITNELKHNIYDLCEEGNIDITARMLDKAVTDCNTLLARFMKDVDVDYLSNDWNACTGNPNQKDDYDLYIYLPDTFATRFAKPIFNNVITYLTYKVLAWWLTIVYPTGVEQFTLLASEAEEKLTQYASHLKPGKVRITPHWF